MEKGTSLGNLEAVALSPVQKLDPEFKKRWVEALRSGKYGQTHGSMVSNPEGNTYDEVDPTYCCLGVAAELIRCQYPDRLYWQDHDLKDKEALNDIGYAWSHKVVAHGDRLEGIVQKTMGIKPFKDEDGNWYASSKVILIYEGAPHSAAYLNDTLRLTFSEIADLIEEQL